MGFKNFLNDAFEGIVNVATLGKVSLDLDNDGVSGLVVGKGQYGKKDKPKTSKEKKTGGKSIIQAMNDAKKLQSKLAKGLKKNGYVASQSKTSLADDEILGLPKNVVYIAGGLAAAYFVLPQIMGKAPVRRRTYRKRRTYRRRR